MAASLPQAFFTLSCLPNLSKKKLISHIPHRLVSSSSVVISCLSGGEVSSEDSSSYVFTRKSKLNRGFAVISNMVNRIQPLDTSVISKGLSDSAKDSMKQTISSMLGLLPSYQFSVSIIISKQSFYRLLVSSIITGKEDDQSFKDNHLEKRLSADLERMSLQVFGDSPQEALSYIQNLQSELSTMKEELDSQKKKALQIEHEKGNKNDLLDYLRSLDPAMVTELSQLSSPEVEEIVNQLVLNVLAKIFEDQTTTNIIQNSGIRTTLGGDGSVTKVDTSRDYLAKLLFWCMLLGHHLRGLENRLHLSCVVRLL